MGCATRPSGLMTASASCTSRRSRPRTATTRCRRYGRFSASPRRSVSAATSARRPSACMRSVPTASLTVRVPPEMGPQRHPVVHLELHTGDLSGAVGFYSQLLCWRPTTVAAGSARYTAMELGGRLGGGIVECGTERPMWLPYVQVESVEQVTACAWGMGATVLLEPREGPAGRRSVVSVPGGAELALWQPTGTT